MVGNRIESAIRSGSRPIEHLGFFAALKKAAIHENTRLFCLDDVT